MVRGTRTLTALLAAMATVLVTLVLGPPAVAAAPGSPSTLDADPSLPRLSWDSVPGATGYDVQVSSREDFAATEWTKFTVNTQVVPDVALPTGDLRWRVRAREGNVAGDWVTSTLRSGSTAAPTLLPVEVNDDGTVAQPDNPPLLRWKGVPGALKYVVNVGTDDEFVDSAELLRHETRSLAWPVDDPAFQLPGNTYHWRVRADLGNGVLSDWSATGGYRVRGLGLPANPSPEDDAFGVPVQDVVLDWDAVAGAARYDVRISADENFNSGVTTVRTVATRWSPPVTVVNDQYHWQVRPVDALGTQTPWGDVDTWDFQRSWPDQPELSHPRDGAVVGDPLYVQWEPVRLASSYTVQFSTRRDFPDSSAATRSCTTTATTLVVDSQRGCVLPARGTVRYYWRVQGVDAPRGVVTDLITAEVRSFSYDPARATPVSPVDRTEVTVPTLRWEAAQGAEQYEVSWTRAAGGTTETEKVSTTSFTPREELEPGLYRWDVRTVAADGRVGIGLAPEDQATFTVEPAPTATAGSPDPLDAVLEPTDRFPTLRWRPVAGADHYRLRLSAPGEPTYTLSPARFEYPAAEEVDLDHLQAGQWTWSVEAWNGRTFLRVGAPGRFTIAAPDKALGHRAGLVGTATGDPDASCDMTLPTVCTNLRQMPVVRWDPVPGASAYRVEVTLDKERTSEVPALRGEFWTTTPMWAHTAQLPDQQAGTAYFVSVRPCKALDVLTCREAEHAGHSFNKLTRPVSLLGPADGARVSDDVTFDWQDFLDTNQVPVAVDDANRRPGTLGARSYEIEVSADRTFTSSGSRVATAVVDQTTFTAAATTLPEGFSYWRVRAIDGSGNDLPWSGVRAVEKRSPSPVPTTPGAGTSVDGRQPFTWDALPFAASYRVEVVQNGVVVRGAGGATAQTALSPPQPRPTGTGYGWRVRRVDASGREGEWSVPVPFTVSGATPRPVSPASGDDLAPAGALFSWDVEPSAARYRFQRRPAGATGATENVLTTATAYAPVVRMTAGRHEWRVVALDGADAELGASAWQAFSVQASPTAPAPQVTGSTRVGNTLSAVEPDWSMPDVTETVQWYRGSTLIPGATELDYATTAADVGQTLKARFTGTRSGWAAGTVDSVGVGITPGAAPQLISSLVVDGSGQVGSTLSVDTVSWDMPDVVTTYQWKRNGSAVRGQTGPSYVVAPADRDQALVVVVTGTRPGYDAAVVESAPVRPAVGEAPVAVTPPGVTGTPEPGQTLSASTGAWSVGELAFSYQWLRGGEAISSGGTRSTYTVTPADAGRAVSVRVTARRAGYADGTATSPALAVARLRSTATGTPSATRTRKGRAMTVSARITASGLMPTGTVTLFADGRKVTTGRLDSRGGTSLRYTPRSTGKDKLVVKYGGSTQVLPSASRAVTITVTR